MQLNGALLNSSTINGSSVIRNPVQFSGSLSIESVVDLGGVRQVFFSSEAPIAPAVSFEVFALRQGAGDILLSPQINLSPSVYRRAVGSLDLSLNTALYYVKNVYGAGSAELALELISEVGVIYFTGSSTLVSVETDLSANRKRIAEGVGQVALEGGLSASAIRRGATLTEVPGKVLLATLEPSHITGGGVRHIGMYGDLPVLFDIQDLGMVRQALIGSLDMGMMTGSAVFTTMRPTLQGHGDISLQATLSSYVARRAEGSIVIPVTASGEGTVFTPGSGSASILTTLTGQGSVYRKSLSGIANVNVSIEGSWGILKRGEGSCLISFDSALTGARKKRFSGSLIMEALNFGNAVKNPYGEDTSQFVFIKPEILRVFERGLNTREHTR